MRGVEKGCSEEEIRTERGLVGVNVSCFNREQTVNGVTLNTAATLQKLSLAIKISRGYLWSQQDSLPVTSCQTKERRHFTLSFSPGHSDWTAAATADNGAGHVTRLAVSLPDSTRLCGLSSQILAAQHLT